MPNGCHDDLMPWGKDAQEILENKYFYVCHAEMNAILNTNSTASVRDGTIYTTMFPCNECAKLIIQVCFSLYYSNSRFWARIGEVVYLKDKPNKKEMQASKGLFQMAGIRYRLVNVH